MRKEAINTFSEGLVMDLNPITTPSNVMTSCLNGTIITYNGNEFVLLNDMGNGRVETAFLPAGYVPVGVKEHGGIIYVASYNPLTNKGQIGSFPSPERNISSNEVSLMDKTIIPENFILNGSLVSAIYKLNLFKGSDDLVLRSGDKFSIVVSGGLGPDDLRKYISNYLNTKDGKIISPKNKALTLKVCTIDANNNLRDITSLLKRIDVGNGKYPVLSFGEKTSQVIKENSGFFAFPIKFENNTEALNLDEYRKNKALNVYNNKVFGELYVVATLNTIQRVDFAISGSRDGDVAELLLIITYYYNCPDGLYDVDGADNQDSRYTDLYETYNTIFGKEEDYPEDNNLILGFKFKLDDVKDVELNKFKLDDVKDVEYLESENLYKVTNVYTKKVAIKTNDEDGNLLDNDVRKFSMIPAMTYADLTGLTVEGLIDLAKLGSGEMGISSWRYYCSSDVVTLTWGFEAYLKTGQVVEDLRFEFYDAETKKNVYTYFPSKKRDYNGTFTDVLGYLEGFEYRRLYLVIIKCTLNTFVDEEPETRVFARWLLTTSLYNEQYFDTLDYSKFGENLLNNEGNFTGLNDINFDISYQLKEISRDPFTILEPYSPDLSDTKDQIVMGYKTNSRLMQLVTKLQYRNELRYPFDMPDRYTPVYTSDENDSTMLWIGAVGGLGEIPESVKVNEVSHNKLHLATESFNVKTNVLSVSVTDNDKLSVRYKAPSFVLCRKLSKKGRLSYTNVLSKYSDRMESILGAPMYDGDNGKIPPFATLLIFREDLRSGHEDRHGYAFFPVLWKVGVGGRQSYWELIRLETGMGGFTTTKKTDKTVTYYASDKWDTFTTECIKEVIGFNPLIIFLSYKLSGTKPGNYFKPLDGHMCKTNTNKVNTITTTLWFNGDHYAMVKGYSLSMIGNKSMLGLLLEDFDRLYLRLAGSVNKEGYLVDPSSSSYVTGGSIEINVALKVELHTDDNIEKLPEYLLNIKGTVLKILSNYGSTFTDQDTEEIAKLMTFLVNEKMIMDVQVLLLDQLADMSPVFSNVRMLSENPIISTPVIIDKDKIYSKDYRGWDIDEYTIYTIEDGVAKTLTEGDLAKYSKVFNVTTLKEGDGEYHLVPKQVKTGNPKIDAASDGSSDSNSKLNFNGIKMIDLTIGKDLMS